MSSSPEYKSLFLDLFSKVKKDAKAMCVRAQEVFKESAPQVREKISGKLSEFSGKNTPLYPENSAQALGPYSPAMDTGNFIFFSGQIALDSDGNFHNESLESEAKQVFANIDVLLKTAGCTRENIVKTTVFLDDLENFSAFNDLYAEYFGDHKPARSCVQVILPKNARVEVEVLVKR